jgi:hypothetical protein
LRKTKLLHLPKDPRFGRDGGKVFIITEMPATQAEKWGIRMFLALKGTDAQIPLEYRSLGMVGVAVIGLNAFFRAPIKYEDLSPLLDEMLLCVQAVPDPKEPGQSHPIIEGEIEELTTLVYLRNAIIEIHTGFSAADSLSELMSQIMTTADSLSTQT